jgi:predicted metal-dependent hydrolase
MIARKFYRESNERAMKENEQFRRGIALFNARKFFEAHEVWEELWLPALEPEKTFLQGLIQLAAAFHHHSRRNPRGTQSLLAAGLAKLERFPDNHRGLELAKLRVEAKHWAEACSTGKDFGALMPPRIRMVAPASGKKKRGR